MTIPQQSESIEIKDLLESGIKKVILRRVHARFFLPYSYTIWTFLSCGFTVSVCLLADFSLRCKILRVRSYSRLIIIDARRWTYGRINYHFQQRRIEAKNNNNNNDTHIHKHARARTKPMKLLNLFASLLLSQHNEMYCIELINFTE